FPLSRLSDPNDHRPTLHRGFAGRPDCDAGAAAPPGHARPEPRPRPAAATTLRTTTGRTAEAGLKRSAALSTTPAPPPARQRVGPVADPRRRATKRGPAAPQPCHEWVTGQPSGPMQGS